MNLANVQTSGTISTIKIYNPSLIPRDSGSLFPVSYCYPPASKATTVQISFAIAFFFFFCVGG